MSYEFAEDDNRNDGNTASMENASFEDEIGDVMNVGYEPLPLRSASSTAKSLAGPGYAS